MEGMSVTEIAQTMKCRPGTIMSRLSRARESLRRRLSSYVEDSDAEM
jgi:DNA-directed RNA polymerase specialized sigma24 family protein